MKLSLSDCVNNTGLRDASASKNVGHMRCLIMEKKRCYTFMKIFYIYHLSEFSWNPPAEAANAPF